MSKILLVESDQRDAERFQTLLANEDFEIVLCDSGAAAERLITAEEKVGFAAAIILLEIAGPPVGLSLLDRCRKLWPDVPVVVVSGMIDASLMTRSFALGASEFLEKPLNSESVKSCLKNLLFPSNPISPLVEELRQRIIGDSAPMLETFRQMAKVIPHTDSWVLFIGDSGTGKELFARAIHDLGSRSNEPWVPVNVGAVPSTLVESAFFGHEKGAFTGAHAQHIGYLEEVGKGTLFLDEIGDFDASLHVKLLRAFQERKFRRLGGKTDLRFEARLVCATNRNLTQGVKDGDFREELYHRIAHVTIHVLPLRKRKGDVEKLLNYFLNEYRGLREMRFAKETLTILLSYPFPGNVRQLQNIVRAAVINCEDQTILPGNLPWRIMADFLGEKEESHPSTSETEYPMQHSGQAYLALFAEIENILPANWLNLPYHKVSQLHEHAFDRVYLRHLHQISRGNVTRAAKKAGIDAKTFRTRWRDCGLAPLKAEEGEIEG